MSAKLGVEFEQCPRTYVAAQTDQECKPDTSVSVVENVNSLETEATAAVCIPMVDVGPSCPELLNFATVQVK